MTCHKYDSYVVWEQAYCHEFPNDLLAREIVQISCCTLCSYKAFPWYVSSHAQSYHLMIETFYHNGNMKMASLFYVFFHGV